MKAISLWQPWATFMALEFKRHETRSWPTSYRGPLAICAAKTRLTALSPDVMGFLLKTEYYVAAEDKTVKDTLDRLPYGCVVCVVNLFDCLPTSEMLNSNPLTGFRPLAMNDMEETLGNYEDGRFAWLTHNCRKINAVPVIGRQGLFNLPPEVEAAVRSQL